MGSSLSSNGIELSNLPPEELSLSPLSQAQKTLSVKHINKAITVFKILFFIRVKRAEVGIRFPQANRLKKNCPKSRPTCFQTCYRCRKNRPFRFQSNYPIHFRTNRPLTAWNYFRFLFGFQTNYRYSRFLLNCNHSRRIMQMRNLQLG